MQPLGKHVWRMREVAHTLCGQSCTCEGCAIAPDMLGEESSLSTMLGAHQPANLCVWEQGRDTKASGCCAQQPPHTLTGSR